MTDNVTSNGRSDDSASNRMGGTSARVQQTTESARGQVGKLYGGAQNKIQGAWGSVKQEALDRPFVAVVGAAAVGAGIGWLIPSGRRETELMAEVAHKVTDAAREAANTAAEVGRQQVDDLTQNALASVGGAVVNAVVSGDRPSNPQ